MDLMTQFLTLFLCWIQVVSQPITSNFFRILDCPGKVMEPQYIYETVQSPSKTFCASLCSRNSTCKSFQYGRQSNVCQLNSNHRGAACSRMIDDDKMEYYQKDLPCLNGGYLKSNDTCQCVNGYVGKICERLMTDCSEGAASGHGYTDGVYNIKPFASATSFPVKCEMIGGGRTIMVFRADTSMNFYQPWSRYRTGFGYVSADHWLGLDKMHAILKLGRFRLTVQFNLLNNSYLQQYYEEFYVEDESSNYRMTFSLSQGHRTRLLGDSMYNLNGSQFSTYDKDNDNSASNCAQDYQGGWWFNVCADCNPTDCSEGAGHGYTDGVYNIKPFASATSFPVKCVMIGGGRTVMVFRADTSMDFYQPWNKYQTGFGDVFGDHWLGLNKIHAIVKPGGFRLTVQLNLLNNSYLQQYYEGFRVEDESSNYRMTFSSTRGPKSRPLGDSMTALNGSQFSAYDKDNDNSASNCAQDYQGGWWFNACADCNPTGRLLKPSDGLRTGVPHEVFWTHDLGNVVPIQVEIWVKKK